jgi:DNA polymerase-3 subunit beta
MKLECSGGILKNAVTQAERVTGKNLTLPVLGSILIIASEKNLKLRSTNLSLGIEISIPAKISGEGVTAVSGSLLQSVFSNINENNTVSLELSNENLTVSTKNSHILIKCQPYEDFPTIPIVSGAEYMISAKKFIEGVSSVYYSCAVSDIKPEIASVYIYPENDTLVFVATDSFRLGEKKVKIKNSDQFPPILIPFKNIVEIMRIIDGVSEDMTVCFSKNQISLSYNGVYITSRLIDGIFPDYKQIMPKSNTTEAVVLKQDLVNALKISNIFSDKFNQISLSLSPSKKLFSFSGRNNNVGENTTTIDAALKGEEVEVNINYKYLLDSLQSIPEDSISLEFNGVQKPIIVRGIGNNSFTYLVMPMNK